MNDGKVQVLILGYGNPGRQDDGLGPALAEAIERRGLPGVTVESNYQLTVEDAAEVARCDVVVFADAAITGTEPFALERIEPAAEWASFTSHHLDPRAVLTLAAELFSARPEAYLLTIRGYEFDVLEERLSAEAQANLEAAVDHVASFLDRIICRQTAG